MSQADRDNSRKDLAERLGPPTQFEIEGRQWVYWTNYATSGITRVITWSLDDSQSIEVPNGPLHSWMGGIHKAGVDTDAVIAALQTVIDKLRLEQRGLR